MTSNSMRQYVEKMYGVPSSPTASFPFTAQDSCPRGCGVVEVHEAWEAATEMGTVSREVLAKTVIVGYPIGFSLTSSSTFAAAVASLLKNGDDMGG